MTAVKPVRPIAVVTVLRAGLFYFLVVFAAGAALGTVRVLVLAPALGATAAVAVELPAMLAIAWLACRRLVRRVPASVAPRLAMGATAFALLMAAELALAALGPGPAGWLTGLATPAGLLGLAGQVAFALLPLAALRR